MTCGEFLKALQDYPNAELSFEQIMSPSKNNCVTARQITDLSLVIDGNEVKIIHDPYKYYLT